MNIFVTGGAGFLGSRVIAELLLGGNRLRCLIRPHQRAGEIARQLPPGTAEKVEWVRGNLQRVDSCREMTRDCDTVIHIAAPLVGSTSALFAGGVVPTRLLAMVAADQGVRRFVLVSSLAIYGTQHLKVGAVLDERCPVDPFPHLRDPYTYSKIAQEQVCWQMYHDRGLPLVVVRPGVLFGPGRPLLSARVGLIVGGALIQMGGQQTVPYCYVDDCAQAVVMAAQVADINGMSFNVLNDDLPSARSVLQTHRTRVSPITVIRVPRFAVGPVARLCERYSEWSEQMIPPVLTPYKASALWKPLRYSNCLAKDRLGWRPLVSFREGVDRTVQALRKN